MLSRITILAQSPSGAHPTPRAGGHRMLRDGDNLGVFAKKMAECFAICWEYSNFALQDRLQKPGQGNVGGTAGGHRAFRN